MVSLLLAALVSSTPLPHPVGASAQATATIRVLSAVRVKLDSSINEGAPPARDSVVKTADGSIQPAKLIEFP